MASVEVTGDIRGVLSLDRQLVYAAARALTQTAKQSQAASIEAIKSTFTTRGSWYLPSSRFGIRIDPATKQKLEAVVKTAADWLALHETGGDKTPLGKFIAIPTSNVRRSEGQIIPPELRPRNLDRAFVLTLKPGTSKATQRNRARGRTPFAARAGPEGTRILFQRYGSGRGDIRAMYILERRARIRKRSTVIEPTVRTVASRLGPNFAEALAEALRTAT